jgi:hypothetical protein
MSGTARAKYEALATRVAASGEVFHRFFEIHALRARMKIPGFREIVDLGPAEIAVRIDPGRTRAAFERGGHVLRGIDERRSRPACVALMRSGLDVRTTSAMRDLAVLPTEDIPFCILWQPSKI